MNHCGFDLGKKSSRYCIFSEAREVLHEGKVRMTLEALRKEFGAYPPMRIVVEASSKSFWVADVLESLGHDAVVIDPARTKAIASARIKNDRLDARMLGTLSAIDFLVKVDRPTRQQRLDRMRFRVRDALVRRRGELITAVRAMIDSEGGVLSGTGTAKHFAGHVRAQPLPDGLLKLLGPLLNAIDALSAEIETAEKAVVEWAEANEDTKLLQTAPGVGPLVASAFVCAVRDPSRFSSGKKVGAYLGLVPSLYASGQTSRRGSITRAGNTDARWLMTLAANALLRSKTESRLKTWGLELAKKSGRKTAVVALARRLAVVLWAMWKSRRAFSINPRTSLCPA